MKILFLEAVQNFGGARKSTVELAKRLKDKGQEVKIVDFWGSCKPFIDALHQDEIPYQILEKRSEPFLIHHPNKAKYIANIFKYYGMKKKYQKILDYILLDFQPDMVVVNNTKVLSILSKSPKYKICFFARGWFLPQMVSKIDRMILKNKIEVYVGVSQATRHAIVAGGFADIKDTYVVPNAIDVLSVEKYKNTSHIPWDKEQNQRPIVLMHCGGFLETKGQHIVLEVAKILKQRGIPFRVKMVGIIYKGEASEKYYQQILDIIQKFDLQNEVEIILNQNNVLPHFYQSDILLHPSSTEGLPRVIMESMVSKKPVIGNAVGGMTDFISNGFTGFLTNFNAIDEYVNYIENLYKDKELYTFVSDNAYQLVAKSYTKRHQIEEFLKILKN